jgi:hypothetical protein
VVDDFVLSEVPELGRVCGGNVVAGRHDDMRTGHASDTRKRHRVAANADRCHVDDGRTSPLHELANLLHAGGEVVE